MDSPKPVDGQGPRDDAAEGMGGPFGVFALSAGAFLLASALSSKALGPVAGTAVSQILGFAAVPAAALALLRRNPASLNLAWPRRGTRLEALLLPALGLFLFLQYQDFQEAYLYPSRDALDLFYRGHLEVDSVSPALILVCIGVVPAFCEEFLFRGVLLGGLRPALGVPGAVIASAVLFTAFHLQALVLLPIFFLGLLLGAITSATRSVLPAVALHFLNNALVTSSLVWPSFGDSLEGALPGGPILLLLTLAVVGFLVWIAVRRARLAEKGERGQSAVDP